MAETPQQQNPQTPKEPVEEKLEFLKREEVRTMAKDIAKVREQQARNEKERIAELKAHKKQQPGPEANKPEVILAQYPFAQKPGQESKTPFDKQPQEQRPPLAQEEKAVFVTKTLKQESEAPFVPRPSVPTPKLAQEKTPEIKPGTMFGAPKETPAVVPSPTKPNQLTPAVKPLEQKPTPSLQKQEDQQQAPKPKRPLTRFEKLFIRLIIANIILVIIFNILAFAFWYFFKRGAPPQEKMPQTTQEPSVVPTVPEPQTQFPIYQPPVEFFETSQYTLIFESPLGLLGELQNLLSANLSPGFLNLVIQTKGAPVSLDQLLEGTRITMPQKLKEKLGDVMFFSFAVQNKKRLGFIAQLKDTQEAQELLRSWEPSMEQDLNSLFVLIGKKGSAYTSAFRSTVYRGIPVRFQTFSVLDFGIVYSIAQDKLILTSSLESFQKVVDQLLLQQTP
jgi:hypothetical protein